MTTEEPREQQLARLSAEAFSRRVDEVADKLIRLAEKIRNEDTASFTDRASYIQHDVLWGVANLNIDNLTRLGREADQYAATAESGV